MLSRKLLCYLVDKKTPAVFHLLYSISSSRTSNYALRQPYPLLSFENNFTNLLNNIEKKQVSFTSNSDVEQYLKDNAGSYQVIFRTLRDIFQIDRKTTKSILSNMQMFDYVPKKRLIYNYNKLKDAGVSKQMIQDNAILLMEDSNIFDKKLESTKKIVHNISDGICFLHCDMKGLDLYIEQSTRRFSSAHEALKFFQEHLKVDTGQICQLISKYLNLVTYHPYDTLKKLKLLLDYKVSINSLLQNNWPMHMEFTKLETRLESYSKGGLSLPVEPSILNCDNEDFNKLIAAHETVLHSLSSLKRLPGKITVILQKGYDYHDIIWSCNVLTLPKNLIAKRLSIVKKLKHRLPNLDILLRTEERFLTYVYNIQK